jgi:hypothetical protein
LTNLVLDFDPRTFGFRKLSDLVRNTGMFEFEKTEGSRTRIRAKPRQSANGKKTAKKK